jgi:hypothetical protein
MANCVIFKFVQDFEAIVEVYNMATGEAYIIHERVVRDSVSLKMSKKSKEDDKLRICTYSKLSGFGHTIYGKKILKCSSLTKG